MLEVWWHELRQVSPSCPCTLATIHKGKRDAWVSAKLPAYGLEFIVHAGPEAPDCNEIPTTSVLHLIKPLQFRASAGAMSPRLWQT